MRCTLLPAIHRLVYVPKCIAQAPCTPLSSPIAPLLPLFRILTRTASSTHNPVPLHQFEHNSSFFLSGW